MIMGKIVSPEIVRSWPKTRKPESFLRKSVTPPMAESSVAVSVRSWDFEAYHNRL